MTNRCKNHNKKLLLGKRKGRLLVGGVLTLLLIIGGAVLFQKTSQVEAAASQDINSVGLIKSVALSDKEGPVSTYPDTTNPVNNPLISLAITGKINDIGSLNEGDQVTISIDFKKDNQMNFATLQVGSNIKDTNGVTIFDVTSSRSGLKNNITLTRTADIAGGALDFILNINMPITGSDVNNCVDNDWVEFSVAGTSYKHTAVRSSNVPIPIRDFRTIGYNVSISKRVGYSGRIAWGKLYDDILKGNTSYASDSKYKKDVIMIANVTVNKPANILKATWDNTPFVYMAAVYNGGLHNFSALSSNGLRAPSLSTATNIQPNMTKDQIEAQLKPYERAVVKNNDGSYTFAENFGPAYGNEKLTYSDSVNASSHSFCAYREVLVSTNTNNLLNTVRNNNIMVLYTGISHWLELVDEEDATTINVRLLAYGDGNDFPELTQTVTSSPVINSAVGQSRIVAHYVDQSNKAIDAVASSWGWPADNSAGETPSPDYTPNPKTIPGYSLVTDPAVLGNFATSNNISGQVLASPTAIPFPSTGQTDVYYVYNLNTYTVSFDSNGGSNVDDQTVSHDHTANEPNNPTKDNHSFVGWYLNPDLTGDPYDFNTPVTGDLTLYAKWQAVINPAVPIQPAPNLPSAPNAGLQFIASSLAWIVSGLGSLAATVLLIVNRFLRRMNSLRTNLLAMLCLSRLAPTAQIKPVDERVTLDSFCTTPFNFST